MRHVRHAFLLATLLAVIGCAGLAAMTPKDRGLTLCNDFMTQYEQFHSQSLQILASEQAKVETKKMVATKINPKLNDLKPLIVDYCTCAMNGSQLDSTTITTIITDVSILFTEARK